MLATASAPPTPPTGSLAVLNWLVLDTARPEAFKSPGGRVCLTTFHTKLQSTSYPVCIALTADGSTVWDNVNSMHAMMDHLPCQPATSGTTNRLLKLASCPCISFKWWICTVSDTSGWLCRLSLCIHIIPRLLQYDDILIQSCNRPILNLFRGFCAGSTRTVASEFVCERWRQYRRCDMRLSYFGENSGLSVKLAHDGEGEEEESSTPCRTEDYVLG